MSEEHIVAARIDEFGRWFGSVTFDLLERPETARQPRLLVKRLAEAYRQDREQRRAFVADQQFAAGFEGRGVAAFRSLDSGDAEPLFLTDAGGWCSLHELSTCARVLKTPLPLEVSAAILSQLVRVLAAIESTQGSPADARPHAELNPGAVFVNPDGIVQVTHLSLSPPPSMTASMIDPSRVDYVTYTAPEQCVRGRQPDHRAMYFTLGMLAFELLTGRRLFTRVTPGTVAQATRRKVRCLHPRLSDVNPALSPFDSIVSGLLQSVPEQRLANAAILADRLSGALTTGMASPDAVAGSVLNFQALAAEASHDALAESARITDITELNAS